jgi:single-strand DNA-binding protein
MQGDVIVTVVGNITADPELRFTQSGAAVANFTVVKNNRTKQGDQWVDGEPDFYRVNVWRTLAENVSESLRKGDRVIVSGKLQSRSYETREGEKRTSWEITADAVGPDLRWATAQVRKADRQGGYDGGQQNGYQNQPQGNYQQGGQGYGQRQPAPQQGDPWDTGAPGYQGQQQRQPANQGAGQQGTFDDPWGPTPARGGGFTDEPPF